VSIDTASKDNGIPASSVNGALSGSPPPDKAVWGRPSYGLPVWRNRDHQQTETILTSGPRPNPAQTSKKPPPWWGKERTHFQKILLRLEIPMAVTQVV
jgi:hypothetical protein